MKKDAVEKKDSDLLSKVQKLRERNIRLQEENPEPLPPERKAWPLILSVAGVSVAAFLIYLSVRPEKRAEENRFEKKIFAENTISRKPSVRERFVEKEPEPAAVEKRPGAADVPVKPVESAGAVTNENSRAPVGQNERALSNKIRREIEKPQNLRPASKEPGTHSVVSKEGMYLSRAAVAEDIFELNPKGEKKLFKLGEDTYVAVWTEIISRKYPSEIRHVYFLNGRKYTQVPLKINYPRMRTWSRITLRGKIHAGEWRVSIETQNGALLGEVKFTVTP